MGRRSPQLQEQGAYILDYPAPPTSAIADAVLRRLKPAAQCVAVATAAARNSAGGYGNRYGNNGFGTNSFTGNDGGGSLGDGGSTGSIPDKCTYTPNALPPVTRYREAKELCRMRHSSFAVIAAPCTRALTGCLAMLIAAHLEHVASQP